MSSASHNSHTMLDATIAVAPHIHECEELPLLRALLQATEYGVLFSNSARQDTICNKRFCELFGVDGAEAVRSKPEAVRKMVLPRLKDPDAFAGMLESICGNPSLVAHDELELANPACWLRRHTSPIFDTSGTYAGRLWTFLDVTSTRRLQSRVETQAVQLRRQAARLAQALNKTTGRLHHVEAALDEARRQMVQTEKLSAVGLLAASTAHDIGNLLTPLSLETQLADTADPDVRTSALTEIRRGIARLDMLGRRLYSLVDTEKTAFSPVDVRRLLNRLMHTLSPHAAQDGVLITLKVGRDLPLIRADETQIEQVVLNLLVNSLRALRAPGSGVISVEAQAAPGGVRIRVTDDGPGVPATLRSRLFAPFVTGSPGGAGLGLFSCRRIVQTHGGRICVRSVPGRTTFSVWLPLWKE